MCKINKKNRDKSQLACVLDKFVIHCNLLVFMASLAWDVN